MVSEGIGYHVTPQGDLWKVSLPGDSLPESFYEDREEAVARASALARLQLGGRVIVHRADGTIEREETLGPAPPARSSGAPRS